MPIELAQVKLLHTSLVTLGAAAEVFTNAEYNVIELTSIKLVNVEAYTPPTVTLYHDDDGGGDFNDSTQIWQGLLTDMKEIDAANIGGGIALQRGGQIGISMSIDTSVSVTIYGAPASRAPRS